MNEADLAGLATVVADRLCGTHEHICVALIRQLALGQPVSAAQLAAQIAMEEPAVDAVLRQMSDIDYDSAGNVVGFGLSMVPTAHQFIINGRTLYTWCALDTFLYSALLGQPCEVVSHCPVTARPITLAMTPEDISKLSPTSSVISLVIPDGSVADCRRSAFCNYGHFFATAEAGAAWLHDHPNGIILPIADAHRLGQLLANHRLLLAGHEGMARSDSGNGVRFP
ncbi:MAG TPA: organomercurial lyase MerB [Roseiflexaceae bacterium]|nr:organomercurial lyase MerB [Roseiflexaceae bacterium]